MKGALSPAELNVAHWKEQVQYHEGILAKMKRTEDILIRTQTVYKLKKSRVSLTGALSLRDDLMKRIHGVRVQAARLCGDSSFRDLSMYTLAFEETMKQHPAAYLEVCDLCCRTVNNNELHTLQSQEEVYIVHGEKFPTKAKIEKISRPDETYTLLVWGKRCFWEREYQEGYGKDNSAETKKCTLKRHQIFAKGPKDRQKLSAHARKTNSTSDVDPFGVEFLYLLYEDAKRAKVKLQHIADTVCETIGVEAIVPKLKGLDRATVKVSSPLHPSVLDPYSFFTHILRHKRSTEVITRV